jgi:ERCC4-type nuclease
MKNDALIGMGIIIDTREQLPYFISPEGSPLRATWRHPIPPEVVFIRRKLEWGDYALEGFEAEYAIERKTAADFLGSITSGHDRLRAEVERATGRVIMMIETGSFKEIMQPTRHSRVHPNSVEGVILSWVVKHGVIPILGGSRHESERRTWELLRKYWLEKQKSAEEVGL